MPEIPKITENAKMVSQYNEISSNNDKLNSDQKLKFDMVFIKEIYQEIMEKEIEEANFLNLTNALYQGASREGIYRSIINNVQYLNYYELKTQNSEELVYFIKDLLSRYTGTTFKADLSEVNFFQLKMEVVEKFLDIADLLIHRKRKDFYMWYALLSAELAQDSDVFENKYRNSSSKEFHFHWAKNVSLQFVKSEIILKLHKKMNFIRNQN